MDLTNDRGNGVYLFVHIACKRLASGTGDDYDDDDEQNDKRKKRRFRWSLRSMRINLHRSHQINKPLFMLKVSATLLLLVVVTFVVYVKMMELVSFE